MRSNAAEYHVLVDSDAFVGRFYPQDAHHKRSKQVFSALRTERRRLVTTNLVVLETATVLSHRTGQVAARKFIEEFIRTGKIDVIFVTEDLQEDAIDLFLEQNKKGTSVVDCSNVAVMRRYQIPMLFSFDKAYARRFGLKVAG